MSYQTNNQEIKEMRHISYKIQSAERRKQRIYNAICTVLGYIGMGIFSIVMALFFMYAWIEEDRRWNPPVADTIDYVNPYETPDEEPWYVPEA